MKATIINYAVVATLAASLSACVVAPSQPIGYRMSSATLPTYVNGQYVGVQPSNYVAPAAQVASTAPATTVNPQSAAPAAPVAATAPPAPAAPPAPVYLQSTTPSVVYIQSPAPVYAYPYPQYYSPYPYAAYPAYPYYSPYWGSPWFGGINIGLGFRIHGHR